MYDPAAAIRADVRRMKPYTPILPFEVLSAQLGRPAEAIIKLDANENPYGPSAKAIAALAALDGTTAIYPDPESRALRAALAGMTGVAAEHLLVGAGADELIDMVMRLFLEPGDAIIDCPPTFGMYAFDGALNGARVVTVPRRADFSLDIAGIAAAAAESGAKLLFLTTPNNPDGGLTPPADIERLLALPLVVVVDEAYIEFAGADSLIGWVPQRQNLVVLRTFSKWAGLAGLRVGYGAFPLALMAELWKIKQPYNLNVAADTAARASVADREALMVTAAKIASERDRLAAALSQFPWLAVFPSRANFALCRVSGIEAGALKRRLAEDYGILVRFFDKEGLRDCIRITAGTPAQTDALLAALDEIGKGLA